MSKSLIPHVSLGLSVFACLVAAMALSRGSPPLVDASVAADPRGDLDRSASEEIARLRADLDRLAAAELETPSVHATADRAPIQAETPPEVLQRLTKLEESVVALLRSQKDAEVRVQPKAPPRVDPKEAQLAAIDPRATDEEKLAALQMLRGQTVDGQDARSPEVVLAMLGIAELSEDENARNDVYRNLHGVKDPLLRDSMLRALASDPSAKVRRRAAEDIDTFLPDAQVENALRHAAANDPDPDVRRRAASTLLGD